MKHEIKVNELDLELLIQIAQAKAASISDGHLTLMKFSTHWKIMFGTPNLDNKSAREEVRKLKPHDTLKEALFNTLMLPEVKNA